MISPMLEAELATVMFGSILYPGTCRALVHGCPLMSFWGHPKKARTTNKYGMTFWVLITQLGLPGQFYFWMIGGFLVSAKKCQRMLIVRSDVSLLKGEIPTSQGNQSASSSFPAKEETVGHFDQGVFVVPALLWALFICHEGMNIPCSGAPASPFLVSLQICALENSSDAGDPGVKPGSMTWR